jgi:peptidoglycan/LPS O-acetylase OafA/YrhL
VDATGSRPAAARGAVSGPLRFPHLRALDGLRGLAVLAVVIYHFRPSWLPAGFLGVDLFFVLSGFLITSLLLVEHERTGRIELRAFWARRMRRLLPALLLLVAVLSAYLAWFTHGAERSRLRGDALATLTYVANWRFVLTGDSYADQWGTPSLFTHAWSLAIEEQFYVVWPLVVIGLAMVVGRVGRAGRRVELHHVVLVTSLVVAGASVVAMRAVFDPLRDPSRAYFGSDTRAHAILLGAALAAVMRGRPILAGSRLRRPLVVSTAALLPLMVVAAVRLDFREPLLYRGGFAVFALAATVVIAGSVQPGRNPVRRVLELRPLVVLGTVSYGLYLWHWPVLIVLDEERTGFSGIPLLGAQVLTTAALTALSWYVVETRFRRGAARVRLVGGILGGVAVAMVMVTVAVAPPGTQAEATGTRHEPPPGVAVVPVATVVTEAEPAPRPIRALLLGDSVAWTIGGGTVDFPQPDGFASPFPSDRVTLWNVARFACELLPGNSRIDGRERAPSGTCVDWRDRWRDAVEAFDPDVVILPPTLWDTYDHEIDGEWIEFASPAHDAAWLGVLEEVRLLATERGATLGLVSSPLVDNDQEPHTRRSEYWRFRHVNALAERFAAQHPESVAFFDLGAHVCTDTHCPDFEEVRPDGLHYGPEGASRIALILLPWIESVARGGG